MKAEQPCGGCSASAYIKCVLKWCSYRAQSFCGAQIRAQATAKRKTADAHASLRGTEKATCRKACSKPTAKWGANSDSKMQQIFTGNAGEYLLHDSIFRRFGVKSDSKPATKYDTKMQKRKGLCFRKAPDLVRQTGLEPVRQRHTPLKRACLPIPALPHLKCEIYYNNNSLQSQGLFGFFITKFCLFLCRRG